MAHETLHVFFYPNMVDETKLKEAIGGHTVFIPNAVIEEWESVIVLRGKRRLHSIRETGAESVSGVLAALTKDQVHRLDLALPEYRRVPVSLEKGPKNVFSYRVAVEDD